MEKLLEGKKILVAGAGGLLGSHLVAALLMQSAEVIAADIDHKNLENRLVSLGIDLEDHALVLTTFDITNEMGVKQFFDGVGHIDGAVNTTYPRNNTYGAHFFDVSLVSFNENLALHLGSFFLFTQQCAAYFKRNGHSFSLVNISSIYGVVAPKFKIYDSTSMTVPVEYAAIKSATLHLNKYAASYVNDSLFRINSVSPGGIYDDQPRPFLDAYKGESHGTGMLEAGDMVGSVLFLLSGQSKFVTGQNIIVDDGFSL